MEACFKVGIGACFDDDVDDMKADYRADYSAG